MINCSKLSFELAYEHVEAHQDDHENFAKLSLESQLNCIAIIRPNSRLERLTSSVKSPSDSVNPLPPIFELPAGTDLYDGGWREDYVRHW
jgi:hypothetical protein